MSSRIASSKAYKSYAEIYQTNMPRYVVDIAYYFIVLANAIIGYVLQLSQSLHYSVLNEYSYAYHIKVINLHPTFMAQGFMLKDEIYHIFLVNTTALSCLELRLLWMAYTPSGLLEKFMANIAIQSQRVLITRN